MSSIINQVPFLRTSREFPEEIHQLAVQVNKTYVDVANAVNNRTISTFPTSRFVVTGENWFLNSNARQQGLRQVYTFGSIAAGATLNIPHGLKNLIQFGRIYGTCVTALPDFRPIPYASVGVNANIDLRVDNTNIIIANGAGGPNITSGIIVLEWISAA